MRHVDGNGLLWAALARCNARTPGEKARAEYAWRVQAGTLDPESEEGRRAYDEAEAIAAAETLP